MVLFTLFHHLDTAPSDRLVDVVSQFTEEEIEQGIESQVELLGPVTLDDGSQAERAAITHPGEDGAVLHRLQVTQRAIFTYTLVLTSLLDEAPRWEKTFETMLSSFTSFPPAVYGVGHDRALIMLLGEPSTMDPALARETTSHFFVNNVFSGLVRFDSNLSVAPDLAEEWQVDETGTVYTFTLREGITFQASHPITADDFKYSIERASEPALNSDTVPLYLGDIVGIHEKLEGEADEVAGVEVVDERTLRITIDLPKRYFPAKLTYPSSAVVDRRPVGGVGRGVGRGVVDDRGNQRFRPLPVGALRPRPRHRSKAVRGLSHAGQPGVPSLAATGPAGGQGLGHVLGRGLGRSVCWPQLSR